MFWEEKGKLERKDNSQKANLQEDKLELSEKGEEEEEYRLFLIRVDLLFIFLFGYVNSLFDKAGHKHLETSPGTLRILAVAHFL